MTWTQTILTMKDAAGTNQPIIAYTDGTNFSLAHPLLDTTGAIVSPATSAKQDTGNAALASIVNDTSAVSTAANQVNANTSLSSINTNVGAMADTAASSDTGAFSLIALFKRGLQALTSIFGTLTAVPGVIPLTINTTATAGRSFAANITSTNGGSVTLTFSDGSISTYPVSYGLNVFPFAVTKVNSSTATGTYENWK